MQIFSQTGRSNFEFHFYLWILLLIPWNVYHYWETISVGSPLVENLLLGVSKSSNLCKMLRAARFLSWSAWCRRERWEDSLARNCRPSLASQSLFCLIWCWEVECRARTGEERESRTCLDVVTVTPGLFWQLSSVRLLPPLPHTHHLIG